LAGNAGWDYECHQHGDLLVAMGPDRCHPVKARAVRAPGSAGFRPWPNVTGPARARHAGKANWGWYALPPNAWSVNKWNSVVSRILVRAFAADSEHRRRTRSSYDTRSPPITRRTSNIFG